MMIPKLTQEIRTMSIDDKTVDKIAEKDPYDLTEEDIEALTEWVLKVKKEIDNPCSACECTPCDCGWGC